MIRYRREGSSTGSIVGTQIAVGIGGGMLNVPAQLGVQASVNHGDVAAATAVFLTILEIGGAVGSAISGSVWTANIPKKLALYLPPEAQADAISIFGNLTLARSYPMGGPERMAINRSYQETMNILLIIAVCLAIPLFPLSLMMKNYKLNEVSSFVVNSWLIAMTHKCYSWTKGSRVLLLAKPVGMSMLVLMRCSDQMMRLCNRGGRSHSVID